VFLNFCGEKFHIADDNIIQPDEGPRINLSVTAKRSHLRHREISREDYSRAGSRGRAPCFGSNPLAISRGLYHAANFSPRTSARGAFRAAALNPECRRRAVLRRKFVVPFFDTGGVAALRYINVIPRVALFYLGNMRERKGALVRNHLVRLFSAYAPLLSPPPPSDRCLRLPLSPLRANTFLFLVTSFVALARERCLIQAAVYLDVLTGKFFAARTQRERPSESIPRESSVEIFEVHSRADTS